MITDRLELCAVGKYDIPSKQKQSTFQVDLLNSNVAIFGSALSGKTNLLKLLINCLHKRSNERNEQIDILRIMKNSEGYVETEDLEVFPLYLQQQTPKV